MASRNGQKPVELQAILEEGVEEGLRAIIGESGLQMVSRLFPLSNLSEDPARFHVALRSIFMDDGAAILEREIARRLLEKASKKEGESHINRSWFGKLSFKERSSNRVSEREMQLLRDFVALAAESAERPVPLSATLQA